MTTEVVPRRRATGKTLPSAPPAPLAIGEEDREIFGCPICSRPLAVGASRCPNCRTRLIQGVPASRAATFVSVGLAVGLVFGGGGVAALTAVSAPASTGDRQPAAAVPSTAPAGGNGGLVGGAGTAGGSTASVAPTAGTTLPAAPSTARSALSQAAALHVRLATSADALTVALAQSKIDSFGVARTLRDLAADAAYGTDFAPRIGQWAPAAGLSADLASFYAAVRTNARSGLAASMTNGPAYRAAATDMLELLAGLPALDADTRTLATSAGLTLPPAS